MMENDERYAVTLAVEMMRRGNADERHIATLRAMIDRSYEKTPVAANGSALLAFINERKAAEDARSDAEIARDERDALRDMLEDARAELAQIREALGVALEPHQSIQERTLEAARAGAIDSQTREDAERYRHLRSAESEWTFVFADPIKVIAGRTWGRLGSRWVSEHLDAAVDRERKASE